MKTMNVDEKKTDGATPRQSSWVPVGAKATAANEPDEVVDRAKYGSGPGGIKPN